MAHSSDSGGPGFVLVVGIGLGLLASIPTRLAVDASVGKIIASLDDYVRAGMDGWAAQESRSALAQQLEGLGHNAAMLLASWVLFAVVATALVIWIKERHRRSG